MRFMAQSGPRLNYISAQKQVLNCGAWCGEAVNIGFSPEDSLVFDTTTERLVAASRVGPPI
jgi:hypothetical protein